VNRTLNALRRVRRVAKVETSLDDEDDGIAAPMAGAVEPEGDRALLAASIEEAARKLSPGARQVFYLHDVEGYTHEEIAQELGITSGGSKSQLFKARAKLRTLLAHLVDGPTRDARPDSRGGAHGTTPTTFHAALHAASRSAPAPHAAPVY
jgi:RNA polymerase sigma-70 factor, ECF subfamily